MARTLAEFITPIRAVHPLPLIDRSPAVVQGAGFPIARVLTFSVFPYTPK